jgi:hypothetical protein
MPLRYQWHHAHLYRLREPDRLQHMPMRAMPGSLATVLHTHLLGHWAGATR